MTEAKTYTIGELADEFGVTLRTLRFYGHRGLLSPERRGAARIYNEAQRARLREILHYTALGFTLTEIKEGDFSAEVIAAQIERLERQQIEVTRAIAILRERLAADSRSAAA